MRMPLCMNHTFVSKHTLQAGTHAAVRISFSTSEILTPEASGLSSACTGLRDCLPAPCWKFREDPISDMEETNGFLPRRRGFSFLGRKVNEKQELICWFILKLPWSRLAILPFLTVTVHREVEEKLTQDKNSSYRLAKFLLPPPPSSSLPPVLLDFLSLTSFVVLAPVTSWPSLEDAKTTDINQYRDRDSYIPTESKRYIRRTFISTSSVYTFEY